VRVVTADATVVAPDGLVASLAALAAGVAAPGASSLEDGSAPEHAERVLATMPAVASEVQIAALID
jgi:hypothetical protein